MIKESLSNKWLQIVFRILIGTIFVYSSLSKLLDQEGFAKAIYNYRILPDGLVNIAAIIIPMLEFLCGVLLLSGRMKKGSSFWITTMLSVFLIALISAYARGLDISCGCFSLETAGSKSDILARIIEDIFLLAGSLIVFIFCNKIAVTDVRNEEGDLKNDPVLPDSSHPAATNTETSNT